MNRESYSICNLLSLLVLLSHVLFTAMSEDLRILSSCQSHCGGIQIPYPFGIGKDCYLNNDKWYEVTCNNSSGNSVPFLPSINKEVVNISLSSGYYSSRSFGLIRIKNPITSSRCSSRDEGNFTLNFTTSPFFLTSSNTLVAVGCNNKALMTDIKPQLGGCESTCEEGSIQRRQNTSCDGYRCCQANIPSDRLQQIGIKIESIDGNDTTTSGGCRVAFLTDDTYFQSNITEPELFYAKGYATVELGWLIYMSHNVSTEEHCLKIDTEDRSFSINNTVDCICTYGNYIDRRYRSCQCNHGYRGSPYLSSGCIDINECEEEVNPCGGGYNCVNLAGSIHCEKKMNQTLVISLGISLGFGLLVLGFGAWWLYKLIKKEKEIKREKRFYDHTGGLLLQQLTSNEGNLEDTKVFSSKELEMPLKTFRE